MLLADGSTKPIKDVQFGDKVEATDPDTGTSTAEPVTALHLNLDTRLADLTIDTGSTHSAIHTTQHHRFYSLTRHTWIDAIDLQPGERLLTTAGSAAVTGVHGFVHLHPMYNLTVDHLHTYYVLAGNTPVLVHNCDIVPFYPKNDGFQGAPERHWLMPGDQMDRFGSEYGRFTSPVGTPTPMRALPPGATDRAYHAYEVVKPFEVGAGAVAPAFGEVGGGTQYVLPLPARTLVSRGVIRPVG